MPTSMLDLPRELYLIICTLLQPTDVARLAAVTKDHYLAVQAPLYGRIRITAWERLIKLVATLTRNPVVSNISAKQRLRWQTLSDEQLRERDVKHLHLLLSTRNGMVKVTGAVLSRCIGAISRRSNGIKIHLTLYGPWMALLLQLQSVALPDVRKLIVFLGRDNESHAHPSDFHHSIQPKSIRPEFMWDLCFGGSNFPDLQEIEIDTLHTSPDKRPTTLNDAAALRAQFHEWGVVPSRSNAHSPFPTHGRDAGLSSTAVPFYGLRRITNITLQYNDFLTSSALESLFGTNIIPHRLTRLEIANCPSLNHVRDMEALSTLLERSLQLVQHLKLHLQRVQHERDHDESKFSANLAEHPGWHICNVVRDVGQNIKSLDLALPFACSSIFSPQVKSAKSVYRSLDYHEIPREPYLTLPDRLIAAGYKHRRLIAWHGICQEDHSWEEMTELASEQPETVSWEIVNAAKKCASWHINGYLPHTYKSRLVIKRIFPELHE